MTVVVLRCFSGVDTKISARAQATARTSATAGPSTHHPQTEKRLGPLSLRMTVFVLR
jgi:hypothetical protein